MSRNGKSPSDKRQTLKWLERQRNRNKINYKVIDDQIRRDAEAEAYRIRKQKRSDD
jgi:hypothetical protein